MVREVWEETVWDEAVRCLSGAEVVGRGFVRALAAGCWALPLGSLSLLVTPGFLEAHRIASAS